MTRIALKHCQPGDFILVTKGGQSVSAITCTNRSGQPALLYPEPQPQVAAFVDPDLVVETTQMRAFATVGTTLLRRPRLRTELIAGSVFTAGARMLLTCRHLDGGRQTVFVDLSRWRIARLKTFFAEASMWSLWLEKPAQVAVPTRLLKFVSASQRSLVND